jgi:hypothetical protein
MPAVVGQLVHVAAVAVVEYLPAAQAVHTLLAVVEHAERDWPGAHVAQGEQAEALAADQLTPAEHAEQTWSAVALHGEARKVPAAQTLVVQLVQGA